VILNYTVQRVLRMVYDLIRQPPGRAVDPQRIYVYGQSMGGTGALALAERYPNVFAAAYAGQPMTNYRTSGGTDNGWPADVTKKWGAQQLNLPVAISAPANWAAHLQKYNGVGVWDWQNYQASLVAEGQPGGIPGRSADDMAPFGVDHGSRDPVIPFDTQARPLYPLLNASGRAWAGAIIDAEHTWTVFGWLPPTLGKVNGMPFWNLSVVRDETIPGLSALSSNNPNPPDGPTAYNQTILWSASWAAWDGAPVDQPGEWRMSFCAVQAGAEQCGSGEAQTVDITPRRLQHFTVAPGATYDWENRQVSDNALVAQGTATASAGGLLTVKGFTVTPQGNRLVIRPHAR
jgi:pimeloyl-ACP methyl ester carboxylesterase